MEEKGVLIPSVFVRHLLRRALAAPAAACVDDDDAAMPTARVLSAPAAACVDDDDAPIPIPCIGENAKSPPIPCCGCCCMAELRRLLLSRKYACLLPRRQRR
jgi:hypothetical protein